MTTKFPDHVCHVNYVSQQGPIPSSAARWSQDIIYRHAGFSPVWISWEIRRLVTFLARAVFSLKSEAVRRALPSGPRETRGEEERRGQRIQEEKQNCRGTGLVSSKSLLYHSVSRLWGTGTQNPGSKNLREPRRKSNPTSHPLAFLPQALRNRGSKRQLLFVPEPLMTVMRRGAIPPSSGLGSSAMASAIWLFWLRGRMQRYPSRVLHVKTQSIADRG